MLHQRAEPAVALTGVEASKAFFAPWLAGSGEDQLWVAHVDDRTHCIHLASYDAGEHGSDFPVGEIVNDAVHFGSAGLIVAHGRAVDQCPGSIDAQAAERLATAADALNITLLDHLIFAGADCTSMRRIGLL